ncbi:MAG: DUF1338 domain-containing protein [Bacteroidales bacterium]
MKTSDIFEKLWSQYKRKNPAVAEIHELFMQEGETIINDHIAFRTYDDKRINIDVIAKAFIDIGYEYKADYHFEQKHLYAKHFEHKTDKDAPKIFISELICSKFSDSLQKSVKALVDKIPKEMFTSPKLIWSGPLWNEPWFATYEKLRSESEYAAWLYVYGFCANHFTININHLNKYNTVEKVNSFLKEKGYTLNDSGGEIKGSPKELLEQSSIKSAIIPVKFKEGIYNIPGCYYEFARRYTDSNGDLYTGFIAKSADKIFESTDFYKKE